MTKVKIQQTIRAFFNKIDRFFERAIDKKRLTIKEFIIAKIVKGNYKFKNKTIVDSLYYITIKQIKDIVKGKTAYIFTANNKLYAMTCDSVNMIDIDKDKIKTLAKYDVVNDYLRDYGVAICSLDD